MEIDIAKEFCIVEHNCLVEAIQNARSEVVLENTFIVVAFVCGVVFLMSNGSYLVREVLTKKDDKIE